MSAYYKDIVSIPVRNNVQLEGKLIVEKDSIGLVIFSHGSGSSRKSPRNNHVADILRGEKISTLLFDLLTEREDLNYENRFDIPLLTERLVDVTKWVQSREITKNLKIGYFGASTGAASALRASVKIKNDINALVSRGGRVDMAEMVLDQVNSATLFIVGSNDYQVLKLNQQAYEKLKCEKSLKVIHDAGHLFQEPGKLEKFSQLETDWFKTHFL
ncbi:MAG: alpha/beta hydrolase [Promethearchaeota archaeon]|nr:MAG: alpha/beta hydrolase [Candidatus Lokiarchaeota archaeon]